MLGQVALPNKCLVETTKFGQLEDHSLEQHTSTGCQCAQTQAWCLGLRSCLGCTSREEALILPVQRHQ